MSEYTKEYYKKNKAKIQATYKKWAAIHRPRKTEKKEYTEWYKKNRTRILALKKEQYQQMKLRPSLAKTHKQLSRWLQESE